MKKKIFQFLLAGFCLFTSANPLLAQWIQTDGPYNGTINCFAVSGANIFAGTSVGVYLSTNNGANWTPVNMGLTNQNVSALAVSGTNLFAGTEGGGVFLSTNSGTSWTVVDSGLGNTNIQALAISGTNLFAGTDGSGVYLSTNNGATWTVVDSGLAGSSYDVISLAVSPNGEGGTNLFAATQGIVDKLTSGVYGSGVYLSTNNGTSWTAVNGNIGGDWGMDTYIYALAVSPNGAGGTNLFAGTSYDGVLLSTDNGTSWTKANSGLTNGWVLSLSVSPNGVGGTNLFAGTTAGGVFLSTNNGTSWTAVDSGLNGSYDILSLTASGNNLFAGTGGAGVYFSTNNGASWTEANTGSPSVEVQALAFSTNGADGTNLFAGTLGGGVYLSTDDGTNWIPVNTGLQVNTGNSASYLYSKGATYIYSLAVSPNGAGGRNLFAGTNSFIVWMVGGPFGGVYLSTNNGTSWTPFPPLASPPNDVLSLAASGTNLFAGTMDEGIFLSTDNGTSWTLCGLTNDSVNALVISGSDIFAGTDSGVFLSTNIGANWTAVNSGLTDGNVNALAFSGASLFAGTNGGGVFLSSNDGTSWTAIDSGLTNTVVHAFAVSGKNLFAGTNDGVFLSTNSGKNWTIVDSGMTNTNVHSLMVSDKNLFAGTWGGGVWRRPLSDMPTLVEGNSAGAPTHFNLEQNYPNPFNPTTVISYHLGAVSQVTLKVFDILGREVRTLVDEKRNPGNYSVRFDASKLPSGVYFYRLQAGTYHDTKKLLLLK